MATPTGLLFYEGRAKPLNTVGGIQPGSYYLFYLTGTTTPTNVYADGTLTTPLSQTPGTGGTTAASDGRFVPIYMDPNVTYRYQLYSVFNQLLEDVDPYLPTQHLTQSQLGLILYPQTAAESAAGITPTAYNYPAGNVLRYGADPTGVADATSAFNKATLANLAYSLLTLENEIVVPQGTYLINGTVYVRKGQRITGAYGGSVITCNNSGTGPTFKMGWGLISGVATLDSGGQPVSMDNLFMLGGPATGCVDFTTISGAVVRDCFFSASGLAINIASSSDLQLDGIFIDVHQGGIAFSGVSANVQITDISFFNGHTDLSFSGTVSDVQITCMHSEYNQNSSVLFADSSTLTGINFTDCEWLYNVQYGTFTGSILNRSGSAKARFNGCSFHNMPGYAYQYGTGVGSVIEFFNCQFDGTKTAPSYAQSTLANAVSTANETLRLVNCSFTNLPSNAGTVAPIVLGGTLQSTLEIQGGNYSGNTLAANTVLISITNSSASSVVKVRGITGDALQTLVNNQSTVLVSIRNSTDWFGPIATSGGNRFVLIPYQFSNVYQVTLRVNQNSGGSGNYRKSISLMVEKDNDFAAGPVATSFLSTSTLVQGAANGNGVLTVAAAFGTPGGGASTANSNSGSIAISWTTAYTFESIDIQQII